VETPEGPVTLAPSDILVDLVKLPGFAAAHGPGLTVVLDTSLTPELIQEGLARDFVRGIQDARKNAGYRIEDTIAIAYVADPEIAAAIEAHRAYVMAETLATDLVGVPTIGASDAVEPESVEGPGGRVTPAGQYLDQIDVGGHHVRIGLQPTLQPVG
jgi:isoleucyl-tRNA synthetase